MKSINYIFLAIVLVAYCCFSCNTPKPRISISYKLVKIGKNITKADLFLQNNDTIDYFLPLIKPAYQYSKITYKDSTKWVQSGVDIAFLLGNNLVTRSDLMETGELDSMSYFREHDTVLFYFDPPFVKGYFDNIISRFEDRMKIRFIYPSYYHAIGNGCVYIKKGEIKQINLYIHNVYPIDISNLHISFDYNTDSIPDFTEEYFRNIPKMIGRYHIFYGRINN
jgi:hypothetical protein